MQIDRRIIFVTYRLGILLQCVDNGFFTPGPRYRINKYVTRHRSVALHHNINYYYIKCRELYSLRIFALYKTEEKQLSSLLCYNIKLYTFEIGL